MIDLERDLARYGEYLADTVAPVEPGEVRTTTARGVEAGRRPVTVAALAAISILLAIGGVLVVLQPSGRQNPASLPLIPNPSFGPAPQVATPMVEGTSMTGVSVELAGVRGMRLSGGFLWAWNRNEIWRYDQGRWAPYAAGPDLEGLGMAYDGETLWTWDGAKLLFLDSGDWVELGAAPRNTWRVASDPDAGTLWLSDGSDLYRWHGGEMVEVGRPAGLDADSGEGYVGEIAVTADGSVWAAGLYGYVPHWGGLARYDDDTGVWQLVRPLGGLQDVPAIHLAPAPDGGLWVMLTDWYDQETVEDRAGAGLPPATLTIAHRNGATGEWTVIVEGLAGNHFPLAMAADAEAVWLAQGDGMVDRYDPLLGVVRIDFDSSTRYLVDLADEVSEVAAAPDGTVWYVYHGGLRQLEWAADGA